RGLSGGERAGRAASESADSASVHTPSNRRDIVGPSSNNPDAPSLAHRPNTEWTIAPTGTSIDCDKPRTVRNGSTCEYRAMSAFRLASLSSSGHGPRQPSRLIVSLTAAIVGGRA